MSKIEQTNIVRATELERLQALVDADIERARRLHADDFQLITPSGKELSKGEYLGDVESGEINYLAWDAGPIDVRVYGEAAVIRYRSELEIVASGDHTPRKPYWHTDVYELRDGRWQVVWSHATEIRWSP